MSKVSKESTSTGLGADEMASGIKYIVEYQRDGVWKVTNWTNPIAIADFPNPPHPVNERDALAALKKAQTCYREVEYRISEVIDGELAIKVESE